MEKKLVSCSELGRPYRGPVLDSKRKEEKTRKFIGKDL
jgi:hypothetical protein